MKEYKYKGYEYPIIENDDKTITYRGYEIERFFKGYGSYNGCSAPMFSTKNEAKQHYVSEMNRIDRMIKNEEYRKNHSEEFKNLTTAEEDIEYFFNMLNE